MLSQLEIKANINEAKFLLSTANKLNTGEFNMNQLIDPPFNNSEILNADS